MRSILSREFDLRYRPGPGDTSFYRLDIVYRHLDGRGIPSLHDNWRGDFKRVVDEVDGSGKATETIVWKNIYHREGSSDAKYGGWENIPFGEGFSYRFSAEDGYEDFHWGYDDFPRDIVGWNVELLTVDAHFEFDFLRSLRHGAIEKLRSLGDSVVTPDSNSPFWLGLPPYVDVPAFNKQNLRTMFEALSVRDGHPCAVIRFEMDPSPFEMTMDGNTAALTSRFAGTIRVRLDDGSVEHGEFLEYVWGMLGVVSPVYEITRISETEYVNGYA